MGKYDDMTREDFNKHLHRVLADQSANDMLLIPGVYEILAEHFNNAVLESWEAERQLEKELREMT